MPKLSECPFCGAEAKIAKISDLGDYKIVANHPDNCIFFYMQYQIGFETPEEAANTWNRRHHAEKVSQQA